MLRVSEDCTGTFELGEAGCGISTGSDIVLDLSVVVFVMVVFLLLL